MIGKKNFTITAGDGWFSLFSYSLSSSQRNLLGHMASGYSKFIKVLLCEECVSLQRIPQWQSYLQLTTRREWMLHFWSLIVNNLRLRLSRGFKNQININFPAPPLWSCMAQVWHTAGLNYNTLPFPDVNPVYWKRGRGETRPGWSSLGNVCQGWMLE